MFWEMTNSESTSGLGPKEHVTILLAEYNALRTEINNRTNHMFTLLAVGWGLAAWVLTYVIVPHGSETQSWTTGRIAEGVTLVVSFAGVSGALWAISVRDVNFAAARVIQIENEINEMAEKKLLRWEMIWGGFAHGFLNRRIPGTNVATWGWPLNFLNGNDSKPVGGRPSGRGDA